MPAGREGFVPDEEAGEEASVGGRVTEVSSVPHCGGGGAVEVSTLAAPESSWCSLATALKAWEPGGPRSPLVSRGAALEWEACATESAGAPTSDAWARLGLGALGSNPEGPGSLGQGWPVATLVPCRGRFAVCP